MRSDWLVFGLLFVVALWGMGCERRAGGPDDMATDSTRPDGPNQVTWEARFAMEEAGRRRATITARRMEQYETEDSTYSIWRALQDSNRVQSFVFDPQGDSSATIVADSVVFYNREGRFEAYGDVVVTTEEGRRLESEHLTWNQTDRTIRTRRFVQITTPTESVQGNGLVADEDLDTYQIGRFRAEVEVEDES
ncbi:MAG: LPS export ABC transporter periplasmic protein LptC [Salinibacter sp.]